MIKQFTYECGQCGKLPPVKKELSSCPMCYGTIRETVKQAEKFATSDERAAEWFKKMRETVAKKNP